MKDTRKKYKIIHFQDITGRYLSYEESLKKDLIVLAESKEEALQIVSEREQEDSEIPFSDRALALEFYK